MNNHTDEQTDGFFVLVNGDGDYCVWPAAAPVPDDCVIASRQDSCEACLAEVVVIRIAARMNRELAIHTTWN